MPRARPSNERASMPVWVLNLSISALKLASFSGLSAKIFGAASLIKRLTLMKATKSDGGRRLSGADAWAAAAAFAVAALFVWAPLERAELRIVIKRAIDSAKD